MIRRLAALALCAASMTACGGIPTKSFEVRAIDNQGAPVPCLIVVDREWPRTPEEAVFTDSEVSIAFRKPRINLLVQPARVVEGVMQVPESTEIGMYLQESRDVEITDPRIHLFILNRNPNFRQFE